VKRTDEGEDDPVAGKRDDGSIDRRHLDGATAIERTSRLAEPKPKRLATLEVARRRDAKSRAMVE